MKTNNIGTKGIAIGIMTMLTLSVLVGIISTVPTVSASNPSQPIITAYPAHNSVNVSGNAGFNATNGFTAGTGTIGDPYILEHFKIVNDTAWYSNIWINDTDKYFIIQEMELNGSATASVYLRNVTHASILDCNITNSTYGVCADYNSTDITIDGNIIENCDNGISVGGIIDALILNNEVYETNLGGCGISVSGDHTPYITFNVTIQSNIVDDAPGGIRAQDILIGTDDGDIMILGNQVSNCSVFGIKLDIADGTYIAGNTLDDCVIGVYLYWSWDVTIFENTYRNMTDYGILALDSGDDLIITKNNMTDIGTTGICLNNSGDATIQWFNISNGGMGIDIEANTTFVAIYNAEFWNISGINAVDSNIISISDVTFTNFTDGVQYVNCTDVDVLDCTFTDGSTAITLNASSTVEIRNCTFTMSFVCVMMDNCTDVEITECNVQSSLIFTLGFNIVNADIGDNDVNDTGYGVMLYLSNQSSIYGNFFSNVAYGVSLAYTNDTVISTNNISVVTVNAIALYECDNITVLANDLLDCGEYDLYMDNVTNSLVYLNYFYIADNGDAYDNIGNDFDNGTVGNYWCNYTGVSEDGDYYGDTPYVNGNGVTDNYPIVLTMTNSTVTGITDIIMEFVPVLITVMVVIMMLNFISKMFKNMGKKE